MNKGLDRISSTQSEDGPWGSAAIESLLYSSKAWILQPIGLGSDTDSADTFSCVILGKLLKVSVPLLKKQGYSQHLPPLLL